MIPTYDPIYLIITGLAMLVSQLVGAQMQRAFAKYSQEPMPADGPRNRRAHAARERHQ